MPDPQPKRPLSFASSMVVGGILVIVLGQAYVRLTPPMYQATTLVSLHRWTTEVEAINSGEQTLAAGECPVVMSGDNLRKVVQNLGLGRTTGKTNHPAFGATPMDAVAALKGKLSVRARPKSLSIEIRAVSDNREEPAKIANELAGIYTAYRSNQVYEVNASRVAAYSTRNEEQVRKISEAKSRMDDLYLQVVHERETNQSVFYDQDAYNLLLTSRVELESVLGAQQRQLSQYQDLNSNDLIQVLSTTETNDLLNGLLVEASHAKTSLTIVSQDHGPDTPEVRRAEANLVQVDAEIIRQVRTVMAHKEAEIGSTKSALANVDQKIKKASTNTLESAAHYANYQAAKEDFNRLQNGQAGLTQVTTDSMRAKVEPFILNYIPSIIQPAETPVRPFLPDPKLGRYSIMCGAAAMALGLLLRLARRAPRIANVEKTKTI